MYSTLELQRALLRPGRQLAALTRDLLAGVDFLPAAVLRANASLFQRLTDSYPRRPFAIESVVAHGGEVRVHEEILASRPFCRLVRFRRESTDAGRARALARDPRVLVCAPLSGHHATLLRDPIPTLLQAHHVYVTGRPHAPDVPARGGPPGSGRRPICVAPGILGRARRASTAGTGANWSAFTILPGRIRCWRNMTRICSRWCAS